MKNVPQNISSINTLFIALHHQYSNEYDQQADYVLQWQIFVEDQDCPHLGPDEVDAFVGVGDTQVEAPDDFLPGKGVYEAVQQHKEQKHIQPDSAEAVFVVLDGSCLGEYARKWEQ